MTAECSINRCQANTNDQKQELQGVNQPGYLPGSLGPAFLANTRLPAFPVVFSLIKTGAQGSSKFIGVLDDRDQVSVGIERGETGADNRASGS